MDAVERSVAMRVHEVECRGCERCALAGSRTQVVYGSGRVGAPLMLVGEAPGYAEDQQAVALAGQAGELLGRLLSEQGVATEDVYLTNVLKCRPPQNRDPRVEEIAACEPILFRQIALVRPRVVATLGNLATRLLSGRPEGITRVHGREFPVAIGDVRCTVYPLYHPAAALYTPTMLRVLEDDLARIPALLEREPRETVTPPVLDRVEDPPPAVAVGPTVQLGLF